MENNEKVLCKTRIKCNWTILRKIGCIIWWVLEAIMFYVTGPALNEGPGKQTTLFGTHKWNYKHIWGMWYDSFDTDSDYRLYKALIIFLGIAITAFIFLLPFIIKAIDNYIAKSCTLTLTEKQICGQLKTLFSKKQIQIPIEKLDNIMTTSGFMDKLRSGETVCVSSNSGMIKFHYVQNAEDFVAAALKRIEEVKKAQSAEAPKNISAPVQTTGGDAMEKINSLKQMLEQGLISQEEFDAKKSDILSKM